MSAHLAGDVLLPPDIPGGEIDGRAIGVSAFLGVAALIVCLGSSVVCSKLIALTRLMCRRRREFIDLFLFTRQYFRVRLWPALREAARFALPSKSPSSEI
jgi:hypothetical protein